MKAKKPKGMPYGVVKRMNPEKPEGMPYEVWKYAQDIEDKEWLVRERAAEALKINL
ncbi:hypothetical protein H0N96_03330, partial [Candidatus Micrarchaeota archaeon]|nr:hypothetical protein [Candidatus Micrarchaeota archaeon]